MCIQIASAAEDFVISHRCMFLEQGFMCVVIKNNQSTVKFLPSGKKIVGLTVLYKIFQKE